jgi:integration host factor alpha subunit
MPETTLASDVLLNTLVVAVATAKSSAIHSSRLSYSRCLNPDRLQSACVTRFLPICRRCGPALSPGLIGTLQNNLNRQQNRARLFESGLRFRLQEGQLKQQPVVAGLLYGSRAPEAWCADGNARVDYYDLKGDLEALLARTGRAGDFSFRAAVHPALHPGQTAELLDRGQPVGLLGALHPEVQRTLDISHPVYVFEIERATLLASCKPAFASLSRFPEVRRDLAVVVARDLPVAELCDTARSAAGECLINLKVFDVYMGEHIDTHRKSVALGLTFQHASRTLNEVEIVEWVDSVLGALNKRIWRRVKELTMTEALTKADLAEKLFEELGLNKREAKEIVEIFFEEIRSSLANNQNVKLSGFGNFDLRDKSQRPGRNPKTGEEIPISARRVVTFRPGQKLKARVEAYTGNEK